MLSRFYPTTIFSASLILISLNILTVACSGNTSALDTIEPVCEFFEEYSDSEVIAPDLDSIEVTDGVILSWKVTDPDIGGDVEISWVLAKNTDDLKKAMIFFDSAQSWNTKEYIFLPVTNRALEIHQGLGLEVPKSIYDEDGMDRIREIVLSGEVPQGSFVDQFDQFMGN